MADRMKIHRIRDFCLCPACGRFKYSGSAFCLDCLPALRLPYYERIPTDDDLYAEAIAEMTDLHAQAEKEKSDG